MLPTVEIKGKSIDSPSAALASAGVEIIGFKALSESFEKWIPPSMRMRTNWEVEIYYQERLRKGEVTRRDRLYRFLASPSSSPGAYGFALAILALSIASCISQGIYATQQARRVEAWIAAADADVSPERFFEQLEASRSDESFWEGFEAANGLERNDGRIHDADEWLILVFLAIFSLELLVRVIAYPKPHYEMMLYVDLLCLVPFIVSSTFDTSTNLFTGAMIEVRAVLRSPPIVYYRRARCQGAHARSTLVCSLWRAALHSRAPCVGRRSAVRDGLLSHPLPQDDGSPHRHARAARHAQGLRGVAHHPLVRHTHARHLLRRHPLCRGVRSERRRAARHYDRLVDVHRHHDHGRREMWGDSHTHTHKFCPSGSTLPLAFHSSHSGCCAHYRLSILWTVDCGLRIVVRRSAMGTTHRSRAPAASSSPS